MSRLDYTLGRIAQIIDEYRDNSQKGDTHGPQELPTAQRLTPGSLALSRTQERPPSRSVLHDGTIHSAALQALQAIGEPVKVQDLLSLVKKFYKGPKLDTKQLYWALEYRRRTFGDVNREKGGVWSLRGRA